MAREEIFGQRNQLEQRIGNVELGINQFQKNDHEVLFGNVKAEVDQLQEELRGISRIMGSKEGEYVVGKDRRVASEDEVTRLLSTQAEVIQRLEKHLQFVEQEQGQLRQEKVGEWKAKGLPDTVIQAYQEGNQNKVNELAHDDLAFMRMTSVIDGQIRHDRITQAEQINAELARKIFEASDNKTKVDLFNQLKIVRVPSDVNGQTYRGGVMADSGVREVPHIYLPETTRMSGGKPQKMIDVVIIGNLASIYESVKLSPLKDQLPNLPDFDSFKSMRYSGATRDADFQSQDVFSNERRVHQQFSDEKATLEHQQGRLIEKITKRDN